MGRSEAEADVDVVKNKEGEGRVSVVRACAG